MQDDSSHGLVGYLAPEGFVAELQEELGAAAREVHGRLILAAGPARPVAWAANVWQEPVKLEIASIGDAAKKLRRSSATGRFTLPRITAGRR
jgi:23S rRNA (cytidine2498-2'-O)-methyltransferase